MSWHVSIVWVGFCQGDVASLNLDDFIKMNVQHRTSNVQCRMKTKTNTELLLFLHLFKFKIRCWTFDVRCSFVLQH